MAKTQSTKGAAMPQGKGTFKRIISHDDKPNFWKPSRVGEVLFGRLLAVTQTQMSPVLQIEDQSGLTIQVGVSTQLRKVAWANYVGKMIRLTYAATARSNYASPTKLFDVEVED